MTRKSSRARAGNTRLDWDDLRYVLAIADGGSLAKAATTLRVDRTTVLRRINSFERKHAVRILQRLPNGHTLTAAGNEVVAAARGFETTIATIERSLAGQDQRAEGVIRVTTTDTLMASILSPMLTSFQDAHPNISLELSASNAVVDLSRREADVAIRPMTEAPETSVGRRICAVAFAVYTSARSESGTQQRWIAPSDALAGTSVARWMRNETRAADPAIRVDSLLLMRELCSAGAGLAALPCYLGDGDARLVRVQPAIKEMTTALWVLTHPDLARTTRIRLFVDFVAAALGRERLLLEGLRARM